MEYYFAFKINGDNEIDHRRTIYYRRRNHFNEQQNENDVHGDKGMEADGRPGREMGG